MEERHHGERRTPPDECQAEAVRSATGDRRNDDGSKPSVALGAAMVDALEDILQWERASERSLKIAEKVSAPKLSN